MFESIARELLQGGFICEYSKPDEWKALQDDDFRRKLNDWLKPIDMVLLSTNTNSAWYAGWQTVEIRTSSIDAVFSKQILNFRPMIQFLNLTMQALHPDKSLQPGDAVPMLKLQTALETHHSLRDELRQICTVWRSNKETISEQLLTVLRQLQKEGYLVEANKESQIFRMTGKISWFYELTDFLAEHQKIDEMIQELPDEPMTGDLFS